MADPAVFHSSVERNGVSARSGIVSFGGYKFAMMGDDTWKGKESATPLSVDFLYLCRGCKVSLFALRRLFVPRVVILDASLSQRARTKLKEICRDLGWPAYDIRERGALVLKVEE